MPLKLSIITTKIAHSKITNKQIQEQECHIIESLKCNLYGPNILIFIELVIMKLELFDALEENTYNILVKLLVYNSMMVLYDYDLLSKFKCSLLAASIILVSFKILQKIMPDLNLNIYVFFVFAFDLRVFRTIKLKNYWN